MVFLVDDSSIIRKLTRSRLESIGLEVKEAVHAEEALEMLNASVHKFDLIISDYNMPGMNGVQLTVKLREIEKFAKTPILILTTVDQYEKVSEGKKAGVTAWMKKPFLYKDFVDTVRFLIDGQ